MSSNFKETELNMNYKSISCENIPELFLDKIVAKNHFSKFGKINKFILRPSRFQCTVGYEQEDDAANAVLNGGTFNGHEFIIKYTENEKSQVRNTEEWVDPDIQSELEAMGNVSHKQYRNAMLPPSAIFSGKSQMSPMRLPKPILKSKSNKTAPVETINLDTRDNELNLHNTMLKNELESIMKKPALSPIEKCNVLDARDKYLRLTTTKTTDIKKVVSTKGRCPDMCPEKERLLRETRDQISAFELSNDGNSMNHKIAVKEYSRSSADQEAPLAHELRPEPVLKMTMAYLLHRIMNLCDEEDVNIGDWFHFVWDRTRSIRKDITQQELCSVGVVELVEQCARFHIHCAARLIAEDLSVFDQKINTENLTKCLQSLKYMYHDLRIKNIECPNESEFRAYIVLLNLNDANFLWEVKQLPDEIRKSKEIKAAIDFYFAVENNNFVKFFKMLRKTTYMNSCILMRYFNQVRNCAVRTIIKAYTSPRQTIIQMPLSYLSEVLAFESTEDAITFFEHHGIECDYDKVTLEKNWNFIPDMPLQLDRYLGVIESKCLVTVGESISGKPLTSESIFENHQPHNSFDNNGYLKQSAWTAEDQIGNGMMNKKLNFMQSSDIVFKIPKNSPPISPKQHQQQHQQIKSLFGLSPQKITPAPFVDETDNEDVSKQVKSSIFASNKLSPVSTVAPIFGITKSTELITEIPPQSIFRTSQIESAKNNLFQQLSQGTQEKIIVSEEKVKSSIATSIFFKSPESSSTIFSSNSQPTANNSMLDQPKSFSPLLDASKNFENENVFANEDKINNFSNQSSLQTKTNLNFSFASGSFDSKLASSKNKQSNIFLNVLEQNNLSSGNDSKHIFSNNFLKPPPISSAYVHRSNNDVKKESIFGRFDLRQEDRIIDAVNKNNNLKRKSISDEIEIENFDSNESSNIFEQNQNFSAGKLDNEKLLEEKRRKEVKENQKLLLQENLKREQEKKNKLQEIAIIQKNSERILSELINEVQDDLIKSIVIKTILEIERNKIIELNVEIILQDLCNEFICETIKEITRNELNKFSNNQYVLRKYFTLWRNLTMKSAKRRHLIQKAQNWAMPESIEMIAKRVAHPTQNLNLQMIHRYRLGIPKIFDNLAVIPQKKVNVFSILSKEFQEDNIKFQIYGRMKCKKYLKFVISLPNDNDEVKDFNSYINSFLDESVERQKHRNPEKGFMCESNSNFAVCIRKITGIPNLKQAKKCDHLNGLIFFFTLANLSNSYKRLLYLLNNTKTNRSTPASLILYKTNFDRNNLNVEDLLALSKLQNQEKISNYRIFEVNNQNLSEGLMNAISFLAKNFDEYCSLEVQNCVSFLQTTIADQIWKRFHDSWLINQSFQLYCTKPQNVVNLYNTTIDKLIDLFQEDLSNYPELPKELVEFIPNLLADVPQELEYFPENWKNQQRNIKMINFLQKLHLKTIEDDWPTNLQELELTILRYSRKCLSISEQSIQTAGYSAIKELLEKLNNPCLLEIPIKDRLEQISWLQIIRPITLELLTQVWKIDQNLIPNEVIYRKDKYQEFLKSPWWLQDSHVKEIKLNADVENISINQSLSDAHFENYDNSDNPETLNLILNKGYDIIERATENIDRYHDYINTSREISKKLDITLYELESNKLKSLNPRLNNIDEEKYYSPPSKLKKSKQTDEIQDAIATALSVIEKIENRIDIKNKYGSS